MPLSAHLDVWDTDHRREAIDVAPEPIERTIRSIADCESADLLLLRAGSEVGDAARWLSVSASRGRYVAHAQIDENRLATFVGAPGARGEILFAHGGVIAPYPSRLCVGVDEAVRLAWSFIDTDGGIPEPSRWLLDPLHERPAF